MTMSIDINHWYKRLQRKRFGGLVCGCWARLGWKKAVVVLGCTKVCEANSVNKRNSYNS